MKQTALYLRVSSDSQVLDSQEAEVAKWVAGNLEAEPLRYADIAKTGTTMNRPEFARMMTDVDAGKIDKIVVWRMDRLGRTTAGLTTLFQELTEMGVTLISIRDGFDLATPSGRLMAHVLASVAQFETELRRERQRAGIEAAKKKGVYKGRQPGTTKVDPRAVWRKKQRGWSAAEIAKYFDIARRTVFNYLDAIKSEEAAKAEEEAAKKGKA